MRAIPHSLQQLQPQVVKRWAKLWKITRKDGVVLRFTDHSSAIIFRGETYIATDGFTASAVQRPAGLKSKNFDAIGVISSDKITDSDLHAGKYLDAMVVEYVVDWAFPLDTFSTNKFFIQSMDHSSEGWQALVESLVVWLTRDVGKIVTRACQANLGDSRCQVGLGAYTYTGTVLGIPTDGNNRLTFTTDTADVVLLDAGWLTDGEVQFTSGENDGVRAEIQSHTKASGIVTISLNLEVPFVIVPGIGITLIAGCNKLSGVKDEIGHCKHKYNNVVNYQGDPYCPSEDQLIYPV